MNTKIKKLISTILLAAMVISLAACGSAPAKETTAPTQQTEKATEAAVTNTGIEITTMPDKVDYYVGDAFTVSGAKLTASYSDGTTKEVALDAEGVEVNAPSLDKTGKKNVTVRFEGQRASFQVNVTNEVLAVTFVMAAEGLEDVTVDVEKGAVAAEPEAPAREGFDFLGWFADEKCTSAFDFSQAVTESMSIYAGWMSKEAVVCTVTFNMNREGAETVEQQVQEGESANRLAEDPERVGYAFAGWFTEADGGDEYDFAQPVNESFTLYAHWEKTVSGEQTYIFEAEDTSLAGKSGPAFSGTAMETGMILFDTKHGASNDRFVGYLYERYNSLEFFITSDEAVDGVTLVASLSAEMRDYTFNKDNFSISVNGVSQDYGDISFVNVPANSYSSIECLPFEDFVISTNVSLKKGMNLITFMTENEDAMSGSTLLAAAPLVDCIKLTSTSVLTWNSTMGLPASNY